MAATTTKSKLNIMVYSLEGTGHLNACIGIAQTIQKCGHKVTFLINEGFKGKTSSFGFREIYLKDDSLKSKPENDATPPPAVGNPVKLLAEQLLSSGLLSGKNSFEKMKIMEKATFFEDMYQRSVAANPQIEVALEAEKPDLIIIDHFMLPPAILRSNTPYVLIYSGNPLMLYKSKVLPPASSGFSINSDPATWIVFQNALEDVFAKQFKNFQIRLNAACNYVPPADQEVPDFAESPFLNIYGYPEELDYTDTVPRPVNLFQVDAFCRAEAGQFQLPKELNVQPGDKLIYVSMGSMGSIDVKLNQRIAAALAKTPYKCIFSKGPLADEYELPANCWGEAFLPQTNILPLVDLVITHGGNNTVTETFSFGKPMIVLPLFGDQWDNAQRLQDKGLGIRLEPYDFEEQQMIDAVEKLLHDKALNERLQAAAKRIESSQSKVKAVQRLEEIVAQFKMGGK